MESKESPRQRVSVAKTFWSLALAALFATLALKAFSPLARLWDLEVTSQPGQLSVYNSTLDGGKYGLPIELGDYNGDGKLDIVMAPMAANGGNASRRQSGEVYVYPGDQKIEGILDRAAMGASPPGLTLWGARANDYLGTEVFTADVNGDGVQDLLVGSQNYDGPDGTRDSAGGVFVILGRPDLLDGSRIIDLSAPPPGAGVITIVGREPGGRLGIWVEAGDLDGDGKSDLILGADQTPAGDLASELYHRGLVAVIYGRSEFPPVIDLATDVPGTSFIQGVDREDHFGSCLHSRDLNQDGRAELIAAASLNRLSASRNPLGLFPAHATAGGDGPDNGRFECGEVKVFFGSSDGERLPPVVDLRQPLPPALAGRVTTIYGRATEDVLGEEITTGDFNGDGFPDLVLGGLTGKSDEGIITGTAVVLYWMPGLEGVTIDLGAVAPGGLPEGLAVSTMFGLRQLDLLGDTLSAGDVNHDGFDDLCLGIPHQTLGQNEMAGTVAVAFGRPEAWPSFWIPQADILPPQLQVSYILGRNREDLLSYSMEARDFDGDGYIDVFPNAMRGDGEGNLATDAGEAYIVSGFHLTGAAVALESVNPPEGSASVETPVAITGTGFTTDADTRLFAGPLEVRNLHVASAKRIEAVLPSSATAGKVEIRMENRHGTARLPDGFEYLAGDSFIRGDANLDGSIDISDPIATLVGLFRGGPVPCQDACDSDDSGVINLTDAVYTLRYLFLGAEPPPAPFPGPGSDPTVDALGCR